MELVVAAFFLGFFPFSMPFMLAFRRLPAPWGQAAALLIWPQVGLWALAQAPSLPDGFVAWGLASALLYGFRALTLRDLTLWIGFIALSSWGLFPLLIQHLNGPPPAMQLLGFTLPLVLLVFLGDELRQRFGAAFAGLPGGLAQPLPRLSALFAVTLLAVLATPLFPAFFTLLGALLGASASMPLFTLWALAIWLIWSWAGARLTQGFLIGPYPGCASADLSLARGWLYAAALIGLAGAGIAFAGGWL